MRLQISLQRHTLPVVNIIFATGTGPASHTTSKSATIFNLLEDLNDLVPLESSETEWGLEDYVVEVAATADQESAYECLHYLPISSVLKEDDEVVVRPLLSDDLRAWRRGGRMQITEDGRHLIDGVVFSKPWTRKGRPDFEIPPRKRRRLLEDDDQDSEKENLEPLAASSPALMAAYEDEYDVDDEDYTSQDEVDERAVAVRGTFDDADASEDEVGNVDGEELQLLLKDAQDLEGAEDAGDLLETQLRARTRLGKRKRQSNGSESLQGSQESIFEGFTSPVRSRVLQDVSDKFNGFDETEAESDDDSIMEEIATTESKKKHANQTTSDDEDDSAKTSSTDSDSDASPDVTTKPGQEARPTKPKQSQDSYAEASSDDSSESEENSSSSESSGDDSESSSDSGSDSESNTSPVSEDESEAGDADQSKSQPLKSKTQAMKTAAHTPRPGSANASQAAAASNQTPPGQGTRRTQSHNARIKQQKRLKALKAKGVLPQHANFADLANYDASMGADGSILPDAEEDLEEARRKVLSQILGPEPAHGGLDAPVTKSVEQHEEVDQPESPTVPETQQSRDRERNASPISLPEMSSGVKDQLLSLEEPGRARQWLRCCFEASQKHSVSQDGMFVAYYRCFSEHEALPGSEFLPCILKEFSSAVVEDPFDPYTAIRGIRTRETVAEPTLPSSVAEAAQAVEAPNQTPSETVPAALQQRSHPTAFGVGPEPTTTEASPKRAKLDVSASRRLIFGALGSRNPKTPAQEKAVREKLSGSARRSVQTPDFRESRSQPPPGDDHSDESWKEKLIITAVECEGDGVTYPPPPFPFVQHWHRQGKGKRKSGWPDRPSSSGSNVSVPSSAKLSKPVAQVSEQAVSEGSNAESRTVSFEKDDRDGMPLPSDFSALADLDKSHLVPGAIIAFKQLEVDMGTFVPQVSGYKVARVTCHEGNDVELVLGTRFRMQSPKPQDEAEGEAKMRNFVIREDGDEDDGIRELDYSALLEAKLIEASEVQVPASTAGKAGENDGGGPETQEDTAAVPESAPNPAVDPAEPKLDFQMDIDTPRRNEISALTKDAGFHSGAQDPILNPDLETRHETASSSQRALDATQPSQPTSQPRQASLEAVENSAVMSLARSSSPFFPRDEEHSNDDAREASQLNSQGPPATSSPPIRPRLTVEYPEIQIDIGSDLLDPTHSRNSSSHQDAQRPSPPPGNDTTLVASEQREPIELIAEEPVDSVDPDSPPLQAQEVDDTAVRSEDDSDEEEAPQKNSVLARLGLGLDGNDSSYHVSDNDDVSQSDEELPSLRELTSSQKRKIMTRATRATKQSKSSKSISPTVGKRRTLRSSSATKRTSEVEYDDDDSDGISLPRIKISASQRETQSQRLSQIPAASQVVDLTVSSDPVNAGNSGGAFELRTGKQRAARSSGGSQAKNMRAATTGNSGGGALGLGQRKFLTSKKTRSLV